MTDIPFGTTIFCDDIREELGGKSSYMGIYKGEMIVATEFPLILPTFAFAIQYVEPIDLPVMPVTIRVTLPDPTDTAVIDIELPIAQLRAEFMKTVDPDSMYFHNILNFKASPMLIAQEGKINVRATRNGKEIRLGSLKIRKARSEEMLSSGINSGAVPPVVARQVI